MFGAFLAVLVLTVCIGVQGKCRVVKENSSDGLGYRCGPPGKTSISKESKRERVLVWWLKSGVTTLLTDQAAFMQSTSRRGGGGGTSHLVMF